MNAWLTPQFDTIPELLRFHPRWLLWAIDGAGHKVPRSVSRPDHNTKPNLASSWSDYDTAKEAAVRHSKGIGFALGQVQSGPTFAGIDLDDCRNPDTGAIEPWAQALVNTVNSYTEISPSGTGLKIFICGTLPEDARQGKVFKLEIYDRKRYFTVTGRHLPSTPLTVEHREERLRALHEWAWSRDLRKLTKLFGLFLGEHQDRIDITCPWNDQHSPGSGTRDAGLILKDGQVIGFNCFHAGCSEKTVGDVWKHFGISGGRHSTEFICDDRGNPLKDNQENIRRAVHLLGATAEYDVFSEKKWLLNAEKQRIELTDPEIDNLWLLIDQTYHFRPTKDFFYTVLMNHVRDTPRHPVQDYLSGLSWDQVPRLDRWLTIYGGAEDTPLTRVVGAIVLVAAVRRVRTPGVKFDEMLILESPQGMNKSTALRTLCPDPSWFSEDFPLNADSKEVIERTLGVWIAEASELKGIRGARAEHVKSMLSRVKDGPVRLAYAREPYTRWRHFIIIGTTNESASYLEDSTGNRRYWPVQVRQFDIAKLTADRDQLWAEAAFREARGDSIRLPEKFYQDAADEQEGRREDDPWEALIHGCVESPKGFAPLVQVQALWDVVGLGPEAVNQRNPAQGRRIASIMQRFGYVKKRIYVSGEQARAWVRESEFGLNPPNNDAGD